MTDSRYKKYEDCDIDELEQIVNDLENATDFLAFGNEIWKANNPLNELNHLLGFSD